MDRSDKMRKDLVEKGSELKALDNETSALVDKIKNFQKTSSEICDKERTRDIPIKIQEVGFSTHGGCDQSKEDAYSSMTPDPTSRFLEVPKEKSYEYEQKNMAEYTTDMCNVVHEHVQQLIPDNQQIEKLDRDTNLLTQQPLDRHEEIFQELQIQIDQVLDILNDDANKLMQRNGSLQRLENKAESLLRKTKEFKRTTKKLQCRLWMKDKVFCITCITILVFILLLIMIIVFYGITAHDLDKEDVHDK